MTMEIFAPGTPIPTMSTELVVPPSGGAITQFVPEDVRNKNVKLEAIAAYARQLKDENLLADAAAVKFTTLVSIIAWWDKNVREKTEYLKSTQFKPKTPAEVSSPGCVDPSPTGTINRTEALLRMGYSEASGGVIVTWRKIVKLGAHRGIDYILTGWKLRAGMEVSPQQKKDHDKIKAENEPDHPDVAKIINAKLTSGQRTRIILAWLSALDPDDRHDIHVACAKLAKNER